ncbi:hypothetical protein CC1G_11049 [Coprinopsis cinerea okayama7|uniref:Uncharacterized protein n=1 Tax=Coprinopsis cinerea (strain Okayama-7 / 130 / ATCC MYA-4618 / FGSC 9003) TaxID=240176 RepID=A8NIV1_COPC7|nr:hypothetical protein CC1G_11049 [Coprinopsis cinerea okayama7\|eukprot:XP_001834079.2 hypothetical protein CC1G_11049 [Coprinopsis cinerea okayama7\
MTKPNLLVASKPSNESVGAKPDPETVLPPFPVLEGLYDGEAFDRGWPEPTEHRQRWLASMRDWLMSLRNKETVDERDVDVEGSQPESG